MREYQYGGPAAGLGKKMPGSKWPGQVFTESNTLHIRYKYYISR